PQSRMSQWRRRVRVARHGSSDAVERPRHSERVARHWRHRLRDQHLKHNGADAAALTLVDVAPALQHAHRPNELRPLAPTPIPIALGVVLLPATATPWDLEWCGIAASRGDDIEVQVA